MFANLATAVRVLTIIPLGRVDGPAPARHFALVGWIYAGVALGIVFGATAIGADGGLASLVVGALIVGMWAMMSGLMHWDGLADSADGIGVRGDATRRLEVMRGSTIGAFGATAISLVLMLQILAAGAIVESGAWWALAAAPVIGRWGAGLALSYRDSARPDGLGARYARRESAAALIGQTLPVVPLGFSSPDARVWLFAAIAAGLAFASVVPAPFARRFGGITGDVLGATIVLTETFVLVVGALAGGGVL